MNLNGIVNICFCSLNCIDLTSKIVLCTATIILSKPYIYIIYFIYKISNTRGFFEWQKKYGSELLLIAM